MRRFSFKGSLMAGSAAVLAFAAFAAPTAVVAQTATYSFNIPAQDLGAALRAYGRASRQQVVFDSRDTRGKRSAALVGTFTADAGLQQLLTGTGLDVRRGASGVLIVSAPGGESATDAADMAASELEEVVVTGTNIRGSVPIGSPVMVITQEDIERSGAQTPAQLLATLPQNFGGGITLDTNSLVGQQVSSVGGRNGDLSRAITDFSSGSSINLRGLGQGTTLILVNGQRLASAAAQSGGRPYTDISSIPLSAVESIEILTDGASAIYGADAIGGVVNFILKKDYVGAQTRLNVGAGAGSGAESMEYRVVQSAGFGWATGNALFSYERYHRDPTTVDSLPFLDGLFLSQGVLTGDLTPEETTDSFTLSIWQDLSPNVRAFADLAYNERATASAVNNFYDYDGVFPGCGCGTETITTTSEGTNARYSATAGLTVDLGRTWNARFAGSLSNDRFDSHQDTYDVAPVFGIDQRTVTDFSGRSELATFDAIASGDVISLPGGPMRLALGGQLRADTYDYERRVAGVRSLVQNPDTVHTSAAFAEIEAPLVRPLGGGSVPFLTLSVAGRYEKYDNFGDTFDPRIGVRIAPSDALRFRASYNTSFKPPSVQQLQPPMNLQVSNFIPDPSQSDGFLTLVSVRGSNPELQPETSENWTIGLDWTIRSLNNLRVEATLYDIEYTNRIASYGNFNLADFNNPAYDSVLFQRSDIPGAEFDARAAELLANPYGALFLGCNQTSRFVPPPNIFGACSQPVSTIEAILYGDLRNLAGTHDQGVDLTLRQAFETGFGRVNWTVSGTYIIDHEQQFSAAAPMVERVDQLYYPIDLNIRAGLGWESGPWSVDTFIDYSDSYENSSFTPSREIASYMTVDLSVGYDVPASVQHGVLKGVSLQFNVQNLFDEEPPRIEFPVTEGGVVIPYDPTNANPDLRRFSLTLVKEW